MKFFKVGVLKVGGMNKSFEPDLSTKMSCNGRTVLEYAMTEPQE